MWVVLALTWRLREWCDMWHHVTNKIIVLTCYCSKTTQRLLKKQGLEFKMNTKVTGTYLCICIHTSVYFCILLYTSVYYMYMYLGRALHLSVYLSLYRVSNQFSDTLFLDFHRTGTLTEKQQTMGFNTMLIAFSWPSGLVLWLRIHVCWVLRLGVSECDV